MNNPLVIGGAVGAAILLVAIMVGGRGEDSLSSFRIFAPRLRALRFTRVGGAVFTKVQERLSVVWVINESFAYIADEKAVSLHQKMRFRGFFPSFFRPKNERIVTLVGGDGFPLRIDLPATDAYRMDRGNDMAQVAEVQRVGAVTKSDAQRHAAKHDQKSGMLMLQWSLFIAMIALAAALIWLLIRAQQVGMI